MKKAYRAPYLAIDFFQLNAALAGSCYTKLYHATEQCNMLDDNGPMTGDPNFGSNCPENVLDPNNPDGYCNQVFADTVSGPYLTS